LREGLSDTKENCNSANVRHTASSLWWALLCTQSLQALTVFGESLEFSRSPPRLTSFIGCRKIMLAFGLSLLPLITASKTKSITGSHHAPTEYFYQNVKLTKEQYEDSSILLKLEHESKHPELIHSHDHQVTFDDLLEEIQHVKKAHHGKLLSPDVIHKLTHEEKKANGHLRSLMKQNNFIELAVYNDLECQNTARTVGRLVNYCYNQYYSSFAFKVNKKVSLSLSLSASLCSFFSTPGKCHRPIGV
jgi:hypothetical protein